MRVLHTYKYFAKAEEFIKNQRHHASMRGLGNRMLNHYPKKPIMKRVQKEKAMGTTALGLLGRERSCLMATRGGVENVLDFQGDARDMATGKKKRLFNAKSKTAIGTWNVRTLWQDGSLELLIKELERFEWEVIGLSEVRRKGHGTVEHEGCKLLYSGNQTRQGGVGILLSKNAARSLIEFHPITARVIVARFHGQGHNISIIQAYAPTSASSEDELEDFYASLQTAFEKTGKHDVRIVMGDFNAKVGRDFEAWKGVIGHHGYQEENERGERLLEFCQLNKLCIMNTWFQHKNTRKWTWTAPEKTSPVAPDSRNKKVISPQNMIDFVMVDQRWRSSFTDTRSFQSASIGSDHSLVLSYVRLRFRVQHAKVMKARIDIDKLIQEPSVRKKYQQALSNRSAELENLPDDVNMALEIVNNTIQEAARETIGFKRKKKKPWISDEVLLLTDKRREVKAQLNANPSLKPEFKKLTQDIKMSLVRCRQDWTQQQCAELETASRKNDLRKLFSKVKEISGGLALKVRSANVKDETGKLLSSESEIKSRWYRYCKDLYNQQVSIDRSVLDELWPTSIQDDTEPEILESEVRAAINKLKPRKASGVDRIEGDLIRLGGDTVVKAMHEICNKIWKTGQFPKLWTQSLIVVIPKKGDTTKCENNRTISLICHASKIILEIIRSRMKPRMEGLMAEEQAGFRPSRGTIEQIFSLRLLAEKYIELQDGELYIIFIDFMKAFDRVWHEVLWAILQHYGLQPKLIGLLEDLYKRTESAVIVGHDITEWFKQSVGVRQGCIMSPDLFNLYLEHIMRLALDELTQEEVGASIGGRRLNNLRFADDIGLIAETLTKAQQLINRVDEISTKFGQAIHNKKTEWMRARPTPKKNELIEHVDILLKGEPLTEVKTFKYLGANISSHGDCMPDIRIRTATALSSMGDLQKTWKGQGISMHTKMRLYRSLIQPIALYGCETWTLRKAEEKKLLVFEMAALRKILGVSRLDKIRNEEIRRRTGCNRTVVQVIYERQHRWLGHVLRMNDERIARTALHGKVDGKRRQGKPKLTWIKTIEERSKLSLHQATNVAQDRAKWRELGEIIGAHVGLTS